MSDAPHRSALAVRLYSTGPQCTLCVRTLADLEALSGRYRIAIERVSVDPSRIGPRRLAWRVPVVEVNDEVIAEGRIEASALEAALRACGAEPREHA